MAEAGRALSVVIITKNEEANIRRCLASLPAGAEIVLLDSDSTDQTVALAEAAGAKVHQRPFDNYAAQKNAAIDLATRDWVLAIDADESLTDDMRAAVERVIANDQAAHGAYRLRRQLVFMKRVMRYGKTIDYPLRLVRRGTARYNHAIHETLRPDAGVSVGTLSTGALRHYSYADIGDYFDRFNRYTARIAANHKAQGKASPGVLAHLLRPWWEFVSRYFFRLGFLDGYPGYCYALFSSLYAFVKYARLKELEQGHATSSEV